MFSKPGLDMIDYQADNIQTCYTSEMRYKGVRIEDISIINYPLIYAELLGHLVKDIIVRGVTFARHRGIALAVIAMTWIMIMMLPPLKDLKDFIIFSAYWLILGIASSIGLGTGLHTFVLYLGPHIAKVALAATNCGYVPEMLPSRWNFDHFAQCEQVSGEQIGIFGIVMAVQLESFLWGAGTAIGQLPPYFVAKKASQTARELRTMERQLENRNATQRAVDDEETQLVQGAALNNLAPVSSEVDEIAQLQNEQNLSCINRAKLFIYSNLKKYGFWAILVCASIPNPLFDLAGITCGHFQIPFKTFFSATFIGKAVVKVHIQMIFVIALFRKQTVAFMLKMLGWISKSLSESAQHAFDAQKKVLYSPSTFKEGKTVLGKVWELFIILMVLFFLKSIVDGQVQEKAIELKDQN